MSNVRDFGAKGDGKTDDAQAILHAVEQGDGTLEFPRGDYLISRTISLDLDKLGRFGMSGSLGTAKIVMAASGPAFHFIGTHRKSAQPGDFSPEIWRRQRMPTVTNLEIEGRHAEADGFLLDGTMQATFEGVLLRKLRHGIHATGRARNLLISHCHIYNNRGCGVYFEDLNLHQAIIVGSHISYCLRGGIRIVGCEVRNLQITGNDIEYNFDKSAAESVDIGIDCTAEGSSVREATIVGNTIQASSSPGGANVRIVGYNANENHKAGLLTISGNLIGSQEINVHLVACRGVVVSGNSIYSGHKRNLQIEGSRNLVLGANSFDHNPDYRAKELCTGVPLADSSDIAITGLSIQDAQAGKHTVSGAVPIERDGLLEIVRCKRVVMSGCQVLDGVPHGVYVEDSEQVSITGCSLLETRSEKMTASQIRWKGKGRGNLLGMNSFSRGTAGAVQIDADAGVQQTANLMDA